MKSDFPKTSANVVKEMNRLGRKREPFFFLLDFLMRKPVVIPLKNWNTQLGAFRFGDFASPGQTFPPPPATFFFEKNPLPLEAYAAIFDKVKAEILYGNSYLLNLTQPTPVASNLTLENIFAESEAPFKLLWGNEFVVFSPERFVRLEGSRIFAHPMKGTISAGVENAAEKILGDYKEKAEHYTIVDLIRNDLNMVAKEVRVQRFRYLSEVETHRGKLLQVSSEIAGELPENWREKIGDLLFTLLPAGSISGAPKQKTIEIILNTEGYERGYYTGVFGVFDGEVLDSAVCIRFIENQNGKLVFKSGGGITALSDLQTEYQELTDKVYVPINRNNTNLQRQSGATTLASKSPGK